MQLSRRVGGSLLLIVVLVFDFGFFLRGGGGVLRFGFVLTLGGYVLLVASGSFFRFLPHFFSFHDASASGCVRRSRKKRKSAVCENVHEGSVCCCRLSNRAVEDLQLFKRIVCCYCRDAISLSPAVIAHYRYYAFYAFYYCCEISARFSSSTFFLGTHCLTEQV